MMTSPTGSKKRASKPSSGLTLIEVLISVILLAGGAILVMQSFATGWQAIVRADERSTAYLFAMSKLADLELAHAQGHEVDRKAGSFRANNKLFAWHLDFTPGSGEEAEEAAKAPKQATLSVHWPRGAANDESQFSVLLPALLPKKEGA